MKNTTKRAVGLVGAFALAGSVAAMSPLAGALPPGGASGSTPGTNSTVPSNVNCGDSLQWSVSGFPAGETVNVKVDDGLQQGSNPDVQGDGVVSQAAANSAGRASGSFVYDCDAYGDGGGHWLRFLATGPRPQNLGYSNKSATFTAGGGGGASNNSGGTGGGGNSGNSVGGNAGGGGNAGNSGGGAAGGAAGDANSGGDGEIVNEEIIEEDGGNAGTDAGAGSGDAAGGDNSRSTGGGNGNNAGGAANSNGSGAGANNNAGGNSTLSAGSDDDVANAAAESESNAPMIGIIAGSAIIILGIIGTALYLYLARKKSAGAAAGAEYAGGDDPDQTDYFQGPGDRR